MNTTFERESLRHTGEAPDLYTVETVVGLDGLKQLEADWRSLGEIAGGPIEQFDWAVASANLEADGRGLRVVTVSRKSGLAAVVPLMVKRVYGARRGIMLGVDKHHEPMDVLASDPASAAVLAQALAGYRFPIIFGRIPADSPAVAAVRTAFQGRGLVVTRPQRGSPYIALDALPDKPELHLTSRRRSDLRRARRRAEAIGDVATAILTPKHEELDALLDELFEVESQSWKSIEGTAMACDPKQADFVRRYAHAACRQGILRLCFLRIDGRAIAMQFAMVHGGSFCLLKIGYDARFARCSPGILLLSETVAYAAREGLATYEFLGLPEPWIEVWTKHKRPCVSLRVYPYNLSGVAAVASDVAVKVSNTVMERVRRVGLRLRGAAKSRATPPA